MPALREFFCLNLWDQSIEFDVADDIDGGDNVDVTDYNGPEGKNEGDKDKKDKDKGDKDKEDAPNLVGLCSMSLTAHLEENGRSMQFGDGNDHKPLWQTLMMLMVIMIIFRVPLIAVSW